MYLASPLESAKFDRKSFARSVKWETEKDDWIKRKGKSRIRNHLMQSKTVTFVAVEVKIIHGVWMEAERIERKFVRMRVWGLGGKLILKHKQFGGKIVKVFWREKERARLCSPTLRVHVHHPHLTRKK